MAAILRSPRIGRWTVAARMRLPLAAPARRPWPRICGPIQTSPPTPHLPRSPNVAASDTDSGRRSGAANCLDDCGIDDLDALATRCAELRRALGNSTTRWTSACLPPAIALAVLHRGWPARLVEPALLAVAADPSTRSPMRLAEAGPWWNQTEPDPFDERELAEWNAQLDELDGRRPALQAQARAGLEGEHLPVTRASVARRTVEIRGRSSASAGHVGGGAA